MIAIFNHYASSCRNIKGSSIEIGWYLHISMPILYKVSMHLCRTKSEDTMTTLNNAKRWAIRNAIRQFRWKHYSEIDALRRLNLV